MQTVSQDVLAVLSAADIDGNKLRLTGQLDRKLYTQTDKVLKAAGGKWNAKAKAHIFPDCAAEALDPILLTGTFTSAKQEFEQFDTPNKLAAAVVATADIRSGMSVLEPSAGLGRLANHASLAGGLVDCYELDPKRVEILQQGPYKVVICADFLTVPANALWHRVVMNPPFSKGADIKHVRHAYDFLQPGGRLVAIMSPGFTFRQDRKFTEFREWAEGLGAQVEALPEGSFKSSGTSVNTVLVVIDKPENAS